MSSSALFSLILIVVSVILLDIFCASVSIQPRIINEGLSNKNVGLNLPGGSTASLASSSTTTPWPVLGQKRSANVPNNKQSNTNQQWVQQGTIWIRNPLTNKVNNKHASNSFISQESNADNGNENLLNNKQTGLNTIAPKSNSQMAGLTSTTMSNPSSQNGLNNGVLGPNKGSTMPTWTLNNKNIVQNYKNTTSDQTDFGSSPQNGEVADDDLREFSEIILTKDVNNPAKYVTVNYQGMTTSRATNDQAPQPLLSVDNRVFDIPSIEKMNALYNNYILESNQNEVYSGQEKNEENAFLDVILSTPVMQHTRNFLINKGKLGKDPKEFKDTLRLIWFNMYSRSGGKIGSSGFEHVFLSEIKRNQVSGLHNWLYFSKEESVNQANYLGYMKKISLGDKGALLKYHFTFHDLDKPVGSMFIGTSPELEMALYSTCFLLRADRICPLKMNNHRFIIRTYNFRYRGKNMIGSAFPEI